MDVISTTHTKSFSTQESRLFTYPSRVADLYQPFVEVVVDAPEVYESHELNVVAVDGVASMPISRMPMKCRLFRGGALQPNKRAERINDRLIFDARFDAYNNVSHLIHNIIIPLMHIKREINKTGYSSAAILVIVGVETRGYVLEMFKILGFDTLVTDDDIEGHVVKLSSHFDHQLFALIPELLNFRVSSGEYSGPKRVFIPRKGDRSLINQDEAASMLGEYGFETVYFEDLSVKEEWEIAENADCAVVIHGAAWSHFVWSKGNANFIDLRSPAFCLKLVGGLSSMVNAKHCSVRGQVTPKMLDRLDFRQAKNLGPHWSPCKDPFKVHTDSLEAALDYMGIGK